MDLILMKTRMRTGRLPEATPPVADIPTPSLWPRNKLGVLQVAQDWCDDRRVAIDHAAIARLPAGEIVAPDHGATNLELMGVASLQSASAFGIAMNSINYMFWSKGADGAFIRYQHHGQIGALAMTAAFQDAWADPASPIARARDSKIPLTVADIQATFGPMPDPESRVRILNEVLLSPKLGQFAERAAAIAHGEAGAYNTELAAELADAFPHAYGDGVLKKAQLAVSGLWREAASRGFQGACDLTAFADYQIPNVLRAMGLIHYDPELAARIDAGAIIPAHSADERAIRGASILAIEGLAKQQGVSVADVDYWIWLKRKEPTTPFHLTYTDAY